jgi:transcriptional regulator of acetoin/glycerol metabolism
MLHRGKKIELIDLPGEIQEAIKSNPVGARLAEALEKAEIIRLLKKHKGNQSKVARILNMSLSAFRRKLKKYNIRPSDYR